MIDGSPPDPGDPQSSPGDLGVPAHGETLAALHELYVPIELLVGRLRTYPVDGGGRLLVHPDWIKASFRLRRNPDKMTGDPLDSASCLVRLADEIGEIWESVSTFSLQAFIEPIGSLGHDEVTYFDDNAIWKTMFDEGLQIAGATCLFDGRDYHSFLVGNERIDLRFRYQLPVFDVAVNPREGLFRKLAVRVSNLTNLDGEKIRPLVYQMDCTRLLFRNELYYDEKDGYWDEDCIPIPNIFKRLGVKGPPQPLVRYEG